MNSNSQNPTATNVAEFNVFLSHNSKDKPTVERLGLQLRERRLKVWLDKWELRPGLSFQDALEDVIENCRSAAICVAENGIGPWEDPEMKALLRRFINEKKKGNILPVIPVLLPGAPAEIDLPDFLEEFTWVDLRGGLTQEGLDLLIWGITGERPAEFEVGLGGNAIVESPAASQADVISKALLGGVTAEDVSREMPERKGSASFDPGSYNWDSGDFPVTVLVSCRSVNDESRIRKIAESLVRPVPIFNSSNSDILSAGHNEHFRFEFRYVPHDSLITETQNFLTQSASRFLIVVSDSLLDGQPRNMAQQIRGLFRGPMEFFCGLMALTEGRTTRIRDIDRALNVKVLAESIFLRELSRTADGLRLKAPPARLLVPAEPIVIRLVQTQEEMKRCLRLRHLIYNRMHYLSDEISQHPSEIELDCYDLFDDKSGTGAIHFLAWSESLGDVVGTARLIVPREFEFSETHSVLGDPPEIILRRQASFIRQIIDAHDSENILERAATKRTFNRLPVLQSASNLDKALLRGIGLSEISRVIAAPRYRGCGVGRLLVRALVAASIDLQKPNVVLECIPAHVPMYKKFGFQVIEGAQGRDESLDQEAVAMILQQGGMLVKAQSIARNDLRMIRREEQSRSLADKGYLCLCQERGCWELGQYELKDQEKCPLKSETIPLRTSTAG